MSTRFDLGRGQLLRRARLGLALEDALQDAADRRARESQDEQPHDDDEDDPEHVVADLLEDGSVQHRAAYALRWHHRSMQEVSAATELRRRDRVAREAEEEGLSPAATRSTASRGRERPEEPDEFRTAFERDRDRIIHSKAFRRLKHKTQVFLNPEGDHFVTRLTHTMQVTQVARSLASALSLNEPLAEAIALGHDVGHSPFGHTGRRPCRRTSRRMAGTTPRRASGSGR